MSIIPIRKFDDLPSRVKVAIRECSPSNDLEKWIHSPIPALGNRSVVEIISNQGGEGELEIVLLCNSIRARF